MAFIGEHSVAIGIFHDNRVSLDRLFPGGIVPPTYGYAYTQAAYDLITPDEALYYVIYSTASGEAIHATLELSLAEYDAMSSHVADTLYIIMDGTDIDDVRLGDTQADKLYLGSTAVWPTAIPVPEWFTPEWYAEAKTYLDGQFTFKPSGLYLDLIHSYYPEFDPTRETQGIVRMYWWNNPPPSEPIRIFIDPTYVSNNEKWWTMQTATASADYCYWGTFYKDQGTWYSHTPPRADNQASMHFLGGIHTNGTPIYAPAMFYAGGTVTANITQPTT